MGRLCSKKQSEVRRGQGTLTMFHLFISALRCLKSCKASFTYTSELLVFCAEFRYAFPDKYRSDNPRARPDV